jgi:YbbR domain-containing protein
MARSSSNFRPGVLILALVIAVFLWVVAQGSTSIRYSFDIPVEIHGVQDDLVVTSQSSNDINVGVTGTRAALRNLDESRMKYEIDVSNAKAGVAEFEVELAQIALPRRAKFAGHSPSHIQVRLERQSRKEVAVQADVQGEPAPGFELTEVRVIPDRVWLAGARSQVVRLAEIQTEPIDVANLTASVEKQVRLLLGGGAVWMEDEKPVTIQLVVDPIPEPEDGVDGEVGAGVEVGLGAEGVDPVLATPPAPEDTVVTGGIPLDLPTVPARAAPVAGKGALGEGKTLE